MLEHRRAGVRPVVKSACIVAALNSCQNPGVLFRTGKIGTHDVLRSSPVHAGVMKDNSSTQRGVLERLAITTKFTRPVREDFTALLLHLHGGGHCSSFPCGPYGNASFDSL